MEVNWTKNSWERLSRNLRERLESLGLQSPDAIDALCGEMDAEAQQEILSKVMNVDKSGLEEDIIHEFLSLVRSAAIAPQQRREVLDLSNNGHSISLQQLGINKPLFLWTRWCSRT